MHWYFPFGGYWQALREGTTAGDVRRLRKLVYDSLGEQSEHVANADAFKAWYTITREIINNILLEITRDHGGKKSQL